LILIVVHPGIDCPDPQRNSSLLKQRMFELKKFKFWS
jgi:hypothetical protein